MFRNNVTVIPTGVNQKVFFKHSKLEARKFLNLPSDEKIILFSSFNPESESYKGGHILSEALQIVRCILSKSHKVSVMIIGGSGERIPWLRQLPFPVHQIGRITDEAKLAQYYSAVDVFAAPYLQDNFPNSVVESLACGTPVVCLNSGGTPEPIFHLKNGFISENSEDFAHGLRYFLGQPPKAELDTYALPNGKGILDSTAMARLYQKIYEDAIENEAKKEP